ncbi:MAG: SelL-related redox protein [Planctomycetota bacterium]
MSEASAETGVDVSAALTGVTTSAGSDLLGLTRERPVLLVFLRHLGCTFCREAAADVAHQRASIEDHATVVFVHMMGEAKAAATFFHRYGLERAHHVGDPEKTLYTAFDLKRGTIGQLFGGKVWVRGVQAALFDGHWVGALQGDGLQMPGVFLVRDGRIVREFRHTSAADRPDYAALVTPGT